jgi:hypothetical protein
MSKGRTKIEEKLEIRKAIVELWFEYVEDLRSWNDRASRYGGHKDASLTGFMEWLNYDYIQ